MSGIRNLLMTLALGLAMAAFVPVKGFAQSSNNPSTAGSPSPTTTATGQPPSAGVGSSATPSTTPDSASPSSTPQVSPAPPDSNPVGTAGQTTTSVPARTGGHGGLIAFIVIVAIIVIAFLAIGANRRTTVPHGRIS